MKLKRQVIQKIQAKYAHEEVDSEGSWAISYGDMITLLLTFFIIFFSLNPSESTPVLKKIDGMTIALLKDLQADRNTTVIATGDTGLDGTGKSNELEISQQFLKDIKGKAYVKDQEIIVEFPEISFFGSAKIDLENKGEITLRDFAKVFMPYMGHFQIGIRAYTDSRKVRADSTTRFKDNLELSALRGIAAMRVLQKSGIPLEKLKVGGYGELRETARKLASVTEVLSIEERIKSLSLSRKIVLVIEPHSVVSENLGGSGDGKNQ